MKDVIQDKKDEIVPAIAGTEEIRSLVFVLRGQHVILDRDLAKLYQVETRVFNQAVSRNIVRFPNNFRFQLTKEEFESLKSQFVISKGKGGDRFRPYAFTEQGIAMLSAILRSDIAIQVSIQIMNTFVEMRRFIANNAMLFEKISDVELKQLEYEKNTDQRFEKVFEYIENHTESEQKLFYDGQIYDAFSLIASIIQKAKKEIILIDGYVNVSTLNILAKKNPNADVKIYTYENTQLTDTDVSNFNEQYPTLEVKKTLVFHDRFIILDNERVYHIGASLKDAGRKCFAITMMEDSEVVKGLLNRLEDV